jgi:site-specific DNA-methyltransferase (adenine-specific)
MQSSRWQDMAALPEDKFEESIAEAKERGWELTSAAIQKHGKAHKHTVERAAREVAPINWHGGEAWKLIHGDFAQVEDIEADSVDIIITDPPYGSEHLDLYAQLAPFAARVLKPGGSLLVMTGQSYLPVVLPFFSVCLTYNWMLAYLTPGGQSAQLWKRKVNTFWKPVLWFTKGEYTGDWQGDVLKSAVNDNDKRFHQWGQSESGMADIVFRFSRPGQLVCDPMCGAGTTGVAAVSHKRRFIGIDIDKTALNVSAERLVAAL